MNIMDNGKRLRQLRGDRPACEVASAVGISESALLMYERGERNPSRAAGPRNQEYKKIQGTRIQENQKSSSPGAF